MSLTISRWARKRADRPRFYVINGRTPLGTVYESKGVFSAIDPNGRLVTGSTSLKVAVDFLCPMTGASS